MKYKIQEKMIECDFERMAALAEAIVAVHPHKMSIVEFITKDMKTEKTRRYKYRKENRANRDLVIRLQSRLDDNKPFLISLLQDNE
jgi:hypothetical protein